MKENIKKLIGVLTQSINNSTNERPNEYFSDVGIQVEFASSQEM